MSDKRILTVRVSLRGRPLKTYRFDQDAISIGRDPAADIFLDNPGVSRAHSRILRTTGGHFAVEDLGSTNGTFLNDEQIRREFVMNNDTIVIGKYSLWVGFEAEQRQTARPALPAVTAKTYDGTTVLSRAELQTVVEHAHETNLAPDLRLVEAAEPIRAESPPVPANPAAFPLRPDRLPILIGGVIVGVLIGVGITIALFR